MATIEVHAATPERWSDVETVFGRRGDDPSWCWCQVFVRPREAAPAEAASPNNREALRAEVQRSHLPPGLIAYVDDHPAGWTRIGPRGRFPAVTANRALARVLTEEDPNIWWVACFAVDAGYRRAGLGRTLLQAAVEFAAQHGATAVEGHPVDVAALKARSVAGSAIYTGTRAMFDAASFVEVARTAPTRPVMRRTLRPPALTRPQAASPRRGTARIGR